MNSIIKQVKLIERIDQLIRLEATGSPEEFATKIGVSKTKMYRMISIMKELGAPIEYAITLQSFVYAEVVGFKFGFYVKESSPANQFRKVLTY
ncbi:hypothetical protein [Aquimarina sp. I32.4]|uniref:hypothetical protein n=1 Tax=Aquimarina sp. I32.4 TaxID=2053903 RepID=UPI000CDEB1FA|nr:hypothetical protein [Aquimarina sp. I32.4]